MTLFNPESFWLNTEKKILVVAEIGKNFIISEEEKSVDEYLQNAKLLVKMAKKAGADAVKFQTHNVEDEQLKINVVSPHFLSSKRYEWVKRNTEATPLLFWQEIKNYCDKLGIMFFSTPMSRGAAKILEKIGVPLWKVGSGDVLDFVLLDFLADTQKPIILSSGMSTLEEIDTAVEFLKKRNVKFALLHCVSRYPCPPEDLNLGTIRFLKNRYNNVLIGFSDHSISYESSLAAVGEGATIIEKHFSLSRDLWGSDHKVSLTPEEFKSMADGIRHKKVFYPTIHGGGTKILQDEEKKFRPIFRKSLVAGQNIARGQVITREMIYAMRPQGLIRGLPSEEYENVLGKKIKEDFKKYDPVTLDSFE